jgi:NAD(P)-dependent dehydrogenase (short-subunit alcohol dehydrogenase family)
MCAALRLDVSSRISIQAFASEQAAKLQERRQPLGVLVNNAGEAAVPTHTQGLMLLPHAYTTQPAHVSLSLCCTGIMGSSASSSSDAGDSVAPGVSDPHLVVNHLGPFLLTNLLLPHMASGSRIVNVASRAHYAGQLSLQDGKELPDAPSNW